MDEFLELRVFEESAHLVFGATEGQVLPGGFVRSIVVRSNDPRGPLIARVQRELRAQQSALFGGWNFIRKYSVVELADAELFHLRINTVFEPMGQDCGTVYDWAPACPICGAGRIARDGLTLNLRKAPRSKDIARTIARDEWILSQHAAELLIDAGLTGFDLRPVRHLQTPVAADWQTSGAGRELLQRAAAIGLKEGTTPFTVWLNREKQRDLFFVATSARSKPGTMRRQRTTRAIPVWYQLIITSPALHLSSRTLAGRDPFDDGEHPALGCPMGDTVGQNLLSPMYIRHDQVIEHDFMRTAQYVGVRLGDLVPHANILISPRAFRILREHKIKGFVAEVAYRDQSAQ